MKLLRFGSLGAEKPGILDANGDIRELSSVVGDIAGDFLSDESLEKIRSVDIESLQVVNGSPRIGACVGSVGKFICICLLYTSDAADE